MDWNKLFSIKRLRVANLPAKNTFRSSYEQDFDRVVFSSAFRRLQDKTQVIPLPENDFVHSRLTHSLEASCVGRSLGRIIGERVIQKYDLPDVTSHDFGAVVAAACLAHDIGNPPFGHSGESAISNYFTSGMGTKLKNEFTDEQWNDVAKFEGNANGFRLLTNAKSSTGGGAQLTFTTLSAFTKYPCRSLKSEASSLTDRASQDKYGYFFAEAEIFEQICHELDIRQLQEGAWCRHPLAFLVEAADDICYRIIDFEDGVRIGLVGFEEAEEILSAIVKSEIDATKYLAIRENEEKIGYLRAKVINRLAHQAADEFWKHEAEILNGDYDKHLAKEIPCYSELSKIKKVSQKRVYDSAPVLQIEVSGFSVVAELLDLFITAINDADTYGEKLRETLPLSSNLIKLLPDQFFGPGRLPEKDIYLRILQICEFVAGMTDTYAVTLYKRLKGIQLPHT